MNTGSRLGPYEIIAPIGAGGMGEVFKARDTRLDRSVAIKILPASFAANAQLRLRFEREAKSISQLNDPHICTLYDVGHENGTDYLVMELIDGESLADRLSRGPMPLEQTLRYGVQIASALDNAHRHGIIHRDLKPANIMITKSGAKLLDFGLAKSQAVLTTNSSVLATEHKALTQEGTILGTFQYMAPEQLEGAEADARTDIFALGAVLYEMATGRCAFEGKTKTSLIAAIVSSDPPPISQIQPLTPPIFEHVVRKCLAKDPDDRWHSAHDVAANLRWISEAGSQAGVAAPLIAKKKSRERAAWLVALIAIAAVASMATRQLTRTPKPLNYRFEIPGIGKGYKVAINPRLSPDGTAIVFGARNDDGKMQLFIRRLDASDAKPIEGTVGTGGGTWSRDGQSILFGTAGKLMRVPAGGGTAQAVGVVTGRGAATGDGFVLIGALDAGIRKITTATGTVEEITRPDAKRGEKGHTFPELLPDGDHFLFATFGPHPAGPEHHNVYAAAVSNREVKLIGDFPSSVDYAGGFLFYVRDGVSQARRFDARKLEVTGEPITVADGVRAHAVVGSTSGFSAAEEGTIAWQAPPRSDQLLLVDEHGKEIAKIGSAARYDAAIRVTPDDSAVVAALSDPKTGTSNIYSYGIRRPTETRLTFDSSVEFYPVVTSDGDRLLYASDKKGVPDVYVQPLDGTEPARLLLELPGEQDPLDVFGNTLLIRNGDAGWSHLQAVPLDGGKPYPIVSTPKNEIDGRFSPDGFSIAYTSDVSGRTEVYVKPLRSKGRTVQITTDGSSNPRWSGDGTTLYFISQNRRSIMSASRSGDRFTEPRVVFTRDHDIERFEPLRHSREFVVVERDEVTNAAPIHVAVRWTETAAP